MAHLPLSRTDKASEHRCAKSSRDASPAAKQRALKIAGGKLNFANVTGGLQAKAPRRFVSEPWRLLPPTPGPETLAIAEFADIARELS